MATYIHELKDWPDFSWKGFEGKPASSKLAPLTKSSPDTAMRDITGLVVCGILVRDASGDRSTSYSLAVVE